MKNTVNLLNDGRVEIKFSVPIPIDRDSVMFWLLHSGMFHGSQVLMNEGQIIGVRVVPEVWRRLMEVHASPEALREFDMILEGANP